MRIWDTLSQTGSRSKESQPKRWMSALDLRKACSSPCEGGKVLRQSPAPKTRPLSLEFYWTHVYWAGYGLHVFRCRAGGCNPITHRPSSLFSDLTYSWGRGSKYTIQWLLEADDHCWQLSRAGQTGMLGSSPLTSAQPKGPTTCRAIFTEGQVSVIFDWVFS